MEEETITHEDVSQVVEASDSVEEAVAAPHEEPKASDKELNFAKLRDAKEEAERRAQQLERENAQWRTFYQQQAQPQQTARVPEEDDSLDLTDAVDSDALKKVVNYFERREKRRENQLTKELSKQKAELSSLSLKAKDPQYLETINKYLPGVIKENPAIRGIIERTPEHEQIEIMYHFATANRDYIMDAVQQNGTSLPSQKPSSIEKNLSQQKTLGAATGHTPVKNRDVWSMSKEEFDKHLQDICRAYPK